MKESPQMKVLSITKEGDIQFIYSDELQPLMNEGKTEICRASHVEPVNDNSGTWYADLTPIFGPVLTGFSTRQQALEAEVDWINENLFAFHDPGVTH